MNNYQLWHGNCLTEIEKLEDSSIDLMIQDPPYYRVKGDYWDRQWDNPSQFLDWIGKLCETWKRKLKPNGSLYVFASPQMAARVEVKVGEYFNVLSNIVWVKPDPSCDINYGAGKGGRVEKESLRTFFPRSERIIFAEHFGADNSAKGEAGYTSACNELRGFVFEPLREYLRQEWKRAGLTAKDMNIAVESSLSGGGMASHYIGDTGQWSLPTKEHYQKLKDYSNSLNGHSNYLQRDYEDLRTEYESLWAEYENLRSDYEDLRRPFFASEDTPYTDVWTFPTVQTYPGKHPCEKPLSMLEHIINTSSRMGATVLDSFFGSCNTGIACLKTGRYFIGIEADKKYFQRGKRRMAQISAELKGEWKPLKDESSNLEDLPLFTLPQ